MKSYTNRTGCTMGMLAVIACSAGVTNGQIRAFSTLA